MHSHLSLSEFRSTLQAKTKQGHPKLKFVTPFSWLFRDSSKPFYGLYDAHTFSLTSNGAFSHSPFVLRGSYKLENARLQVNYTVGPRFAWQYWFWGLWVVAVCGFMMYINRMLYATTQSDNLIPIDCFFVFLLGFAVLTTLRSRKKLEQKFKQVFQIYP